MSRIVTPASLQFHKTKGAFRATAFPAKVNSDTRGEKTFTSLEPGVIFLECAAPREGQTRSYNWEQKVTLAITALEAEKIAELASAKDDAKVDIFHDPGMKSDAQGQITKSLQVARLTQPKLGFAFNFLLKKGTTSNKAGIVLDPTEFRVLARYFAASLPVIYGLTAPVTMSWGEGVPARA